VCFNVKYFVLHIIAVVVLLKLHFKRFNMLTGTYCKYLGTYNLGIPMFVSVLNKTFTFKYLILYQHYVMIILIRVNFNCL